VAVRLSRVRQLVASGDARAKIVEALLGDLQRVVSGVQVGITLTSLALGALGESTLAAGFQSLWAGGTGKYSVLNRACGGADLCVRSSERATTSWWASWSPKRSAWRAPNGWRCWWRDPSAGS